MKQPSIFLSRFSVIMLLAFLSCSEEGDAPIPLQANAGDDMAATVATAVTLDGSASTGPEGFSYEWTYTGGAAANESEINFTNVNSSSATFTPPKNGTYSFGLRIEHNGQFSEDQIMVTVTGVLTLPATISTTTVLVDIEQDPTKPDYQASGMVTIQAGANISAPSSSQGVVVHFTESGGLHIQGGNVDLSGVQMSASSGWKGILLSGGSLTLQAAAKVDKAGKSAFDGQTEAASLVMTGGNLKMSQTFFTGSMGLHDVLVSGGTFTEISYSNTFSTTKPIKMGIAYVTQFQSNTMPDTYEYLVLTTPGASTVATSPATNGFQFYNYKYFIDGDFTAGSMVHFNNGAKIYMKEGTGILQSSGTMTSSGSSATGIVMDGLNGADWKGIAIGAGATASLSGIEIKNAGSAVFSTGAFTSSFKAAVYYASTNGNGQIKDSNITDSNGYGVYIDSPPGVYMLTGVGNTISNSANAAISVMVNHVGAAVPSSFSTTFTMGSNLPAVEVRSPNPNNYQPNGTWPALGVSNYYLVTGSITHGSSTWTLAPGVSLKFKAGKSLSIQANFVAQGTVNQPVIFDSEAGTNGTWTGMIVESTYNMQYCQIKNGGELLVFTNNFQAATEKANIVFNYSGTSNANLFKNNTISGSAGYGILVEDLRQNPDAENVANANTFSNNVSGNVVIK